jgi:hypothetical protein
MSVTYSFTTSLGDVLTRAPLGAAYLDDIRQDEGTTTPVIANRVPPPKIYAQVECANEAPYSFTAGDVLVVYCPTHGYAESSAEPFNISDGDTLEVRVDGGYLQELILTGLTSGAATAEQVAQSIALQLRKAIPRLTASETTVTMISNAVGSTSTVAVEGGTAATALGFTSSSGGDNSESATFLGTETTANDVAALINFEISNAWAEIGGNSRVRLYTEEDRIYCTGRAAEILGFTAYAMVETSQAQPYILKERDTLKIKVDDGYEQTITLTSSEIADITNASAEMLIQQLNFALEGATAELNDAEDGIEIRSNTESTSSKIEITGGSAVSVLGLTDATATGVGYGDSITYEALADDPIVFDLFDTSTAGLGDFSVYVTTNHEKTLVYDSSVPFTETGWSVTVTTELSPGSLVIDIYHVEITHTTDFISDEIVEVQVIAATVTPSTLNATYEFAVEDTRQPSIVKLTSWSPRKLRIKFSEPMDRTDDPTSSLYTQDISGRISYFESDGGYANVVEAPTADFVSGDVGLFLGSAGAQNSENNFAAEILTVINSTKVQVDQTLKDEDAVDPEDYEPPLVTVSPYRIVRVEQDDPYQPTFAPIVESVSALETDEIPSGDETERYLEIVFHDDLSPASSYRLEATNITDPAGNEIGSTYDFTSWALRTIPNRAWDLTTMIPQHNWDQDNSGDLAKLMNCFNEVAQVLLNDVDQFGDLLDPWTTKDDVVDIILEDLGNPFTFVQSLTLVKKRSLKSGALFR